MKLNQVESTFQEIQSMYDSSEIDRICYVSWLEQLGLDKVVAVDDNENYRKEQLTKIISDALK